MATVHFGVQQDAVAGIRIMKVLGLAPDVWISSAALLEDGRIVAGAAEERFTRQKMSKAFPAHALDYCLRQAGCTLKDIDIIAVPWNPGVHIRSASPRYISNARWRGEYLVNVPAAILRHLASPEVEQIDQLVRIPGKELRITFVNHHSAHAACAFYLSPFDEAAILSVDGRGENETVTWSHGRGSEIRKLQAVGFPHSLGEFYSAITQYLGFKPYQDEWKVMALASYGQRNNEYYSSLRRLIRYMEDGGFELDLSYFSYFLFDMQPAMYSAKLEALLGPSRGAGDLPDQRHSDIACALQQVYEETLGHLLARLHALTGQTRVVLAGGSAMNSVYNGKIQDTTPFKEHFVPSCPDDSGVSVGAALYAYYCLAGGRLREKPEHNYWGPDFSDREIEEALSKYKVRAERHQDIAAVAARLLAGGKLIGWFQGRMEFGQRALGNRSILADPRQAQVKDLVNAAVKYRESFRPFAPAVLEEHAHEYFELPKGVTVPFMEKVYPVRPAMRDRIPAVVHVDGSGRLQTVSRQTNPDFYDLIRQFQVLSGIPVLLNTSFNLNGEPIVCSPTDAIRTFYSCGLDGLVLGKWLVLKDGQS
jgi:carbamoyltransferase